MRFTLLEQCSAEPVSGLGVARLHLGFCAKLLFRFVPTCGAGVDQPQFQMQPRNFRTLTQRFAEFRRGLRHLPQHKVILSHRLVGARGVGVCAEESVDRAFGKKTAGPAEIIQHIRIAGTFHQCRIQVCDCLLVLSCINLSDSQSFLRVHALQMRNGLLRVTLRQQSIAQLQVRGVEIRA